MDFSGLSKNIAEVLARAGRAAAGRAVTVVAATKTVPRDIIAALPGYNISAAGENRVQEFLGKYAPDLIPEWHFIGRLQTNKVKYLADKVSLIQSVDRTELAAEIDRQCALKNIPNMDVLVEVNPGGEAQKGGVSLVQAESFIDSLSVFPRVTVKGLMAVMPANVNTPDLYLQTGALYGILKEKYAKQGRPFQFLSMGMSNDFEIALRCGANMIRIGAAIFGERQTP
jgi:pyridoxal phosphate enzyme (YggS family)